MNTRHVITSAVLSLLAATASLLCVVALTAPKLSTAIMAATLIVSFAVLSVTCAANARSWLKYHRPTHLRLAGTLFATGVFLIGFMLCSGLAWDAHWIQSHGPIYDIWFLPGLLCLHYAYQATKTPHPFTTIGSIPLLFIATFFFIVGFTMTIINPTHLDGPAPTIPLSFTDRILAGIILLPPSTALIIRQTHRLLHPPTHETYQHTGPTPGLSTTHGNGGPWGLLIASLIPLPVAIFIPINYYLNQQGHLSPANDRAAHYVIAGLTTLVATGLTLSTRRILWERKHQRSVQEPHEAQSNVGESQVKPD